MAWCPDCKNEYRAGITICPDCNKELVEELTDTSFSEYVLLFQTDNAHLKEKVVAYLSHCGISVLEHTGVPNSEETSLEETNMKETSLEETSLEETNLEETNLEKANLDETDSDTAAFDITASGEELSVMYSVFVPEKDRKEAFQELKTVLSVDAKEQKDDPASETENKRFDSEPAAVFVDAKNRYQEYRSSGIMFLCFSVILFVFTLLNITGVLQLMTSSLSHALLIILTVIFTFAGIDSLRKTVSLKEEAKQEELKTEQLQAFLAEHFPKEALTAMAEPDLSVEILYLKQMEIMKEKACEAFDSLEDNYLDAILEDYYNSIF